MQETIRREIQLLAVLATCGATGCYTGWQGGDDGSGDASPTAGPSDGGAADADGGDPDGGSGDDTTGGEPGACGDPLRSLGASPLQRLTRLEYNLAVEDLLGDDTRPANILPDDDRVGSFASNSLTDVPEHTVSLYAAIAESVAERAAQNIEAIVECDPSLGRDCAEGFIVDFGRRAYRRPLEVDEVDRLLGVFDLGAEEGFSSGIQLTLEAMLQSPHFLYRVEEGIPTESEYVVALSPYELASRLSFFAWKSTPDDLLLDAAESGALATPDGLRAQAQRLLSDERALVAVEAFHEQWLGLEGDHGLDVASKDPELFPAFSDSLKTAMRAEQNAFVRHVFLEEGASLDTLLTARFTFANAELAALYGIEGVQGDDLVRVELDPGQRIGILTQAGVLTTGAGPSDTSTTLRGKLINDQVLCGVVPPPPPDVNDVLGEREEGETKKEQVEAHMSDPTCFACHQYMDPIGFGFENYDPIGAFRTEDRGFEVDAVGEVTSPDPALAGTFDGPIELVERIAASETVARCMATQWSRFALGRQVGLEEEECVVDAAYQAFEDSDRDIRELMIELVLLDSFRYRHLPTTEED